MLWRHFKESKSKTFYRLSIAKSKLSADDTNSDDPRRINRGYSFINDITEISVVWNTPFEI